MTLTSHVRTYILVAIVMGTACQLDLADDHLDTVESAVLDPATLVGYWPFSEGSGTTTADASGNGHQGTLLGSSGGGSSGLPTWTTTGASGAALNFSGASPGVEPSFSPAFNLTNQVSISAFVTLNSTWGWKTIAMKTTNASWTDGYGLYYYGGQLCGYVANYYNYRACVAFPTTSSVTHVAFTYDRINLKLYVNGAEVAHAQPNVAISTTGQPFRIGVQGGFYPWDGMIDEVRLFDRGLSLAEVQQLSQPTGSVPGAIGYWPFNEGTGTTTADASGNGHPGTLIGSSGATSLLSTWTAGEAGMALSIPGITPTTFTGVEAAASTGLNLSQVSISALVTLNNTPGSAYWKTIAMKTSNGSWTDGYGLYYAGGQLCGYVTQYWGHAACAPFAPTQAWTHVAFTYDQSYLRLYINGTEVTSVPDTVAISPTAQPFRIGTQGVSGQQPYPYPWDGKIDEVRLFNRGLSAAEVQQLYQPPPSSTSINVATCGTATLTWTSPRYGCSVNTWDVFRCADANHCVPWINGQPNASTNSANDQGLGQNAPLMYKVVGHSNCGDNTPAFASATTPACVGTSVYTGGSTNINALEAVDVARTSAGDVYMVSNTSTGFIVAKTHADGTPVWSRQFTGTGTATANAIAADTSAAYVTGGFSGTIDFGSGTGSATAQSYRDVMLIKLDGTNATGSTLVWHTWGSDLTEISQDDVGTGIALEPAGGSLYLVGSGGCNLNIAGGQSGQAAPAGMGVDSVGVGTPEPLGFVARIDTSTLVADWKEKIGDCNVSNTKVTVTDVAFNATAGKVAAVGYFRGQITMANEASLATTGSAGIDSFAMVFSASGWSYSTTHWVAQFGKPESGAFPNDEHTEGVAFNDDGTDLYLTGDLKGMCTTATCDDFTFNMCHGNTCNTTGGGTLLKSGIGTTVFAARVKVAPDNGAGSPLHLPKTGWSRSYPNASNSADTTDSKSNAIAVAGTVTNGGTAKVMIAGQLGAPGIAFGGGGSALNIAVAGTAYAASFNDTTASPAVSTWSRAASGPGKVRKVIVNNSGQATLVGSYSGTPFSWDTTSYATPSGAFTANLQ